MMGRSETKPFEISKKEVWEAYHRVKANRGTPGVDGITLAEFEQNLGKNLYRIWNRLASGSYFPPPVKRVEIPKGDGKTRPLGIPTVGDRIAQMVVKQRLEPILEPVFHQDSFGYRPGRSAHDALRKARERCWQRNWVLDLDIKGFFDNLDHELMLRAVQRHAKDKWVVLYIERWLKAPVQLPDGSRQQRDRGTPQGGVISPLLANLFLHYAFDAWMQRRHPEVAFERYADDIICHCGSESEASALRAEIAERLTACQLELHPEKTKVVYCADANRRERHVVQQFDFLGYTFRPRQAKNKRGLLFTSFMPGVSGKSGKAMRQTIRGWGLQRLSRYDLIQLMNRYSPILAGWVRYYGRFYPSALRKALRTWDLHLVKWAMRKYKRLRGHLYRAWGWLARLKRRAPTLFPHWSIQNG
jgi:group II intron reverse transcriptase/maturase